MKKSQNFVWAINRKQSGFSLIELLVVIGIIGVLSMVVLVSLGVARGKGSNAGIKTAFAQLRTQSNLYINDNGNYGTALANGTCNTASTVFADVRFNQIVLDAQDASGNGSVPKCYNSLGFGGSWSVSLPLNKTENTYNYTCVDASGVIKYYAANQTWAATCP